MKITIDFLEDSVEIEADGYELERFIEIIQLAMKRINHEQGFHPGGSEKYVMVTCTSALEDDD